MNNIACSKDENYINQILAAQILFTNHVLTWLSDLLYILLSARINYFSRLTCVCVYELLSRSLYYI